MLHASKQITIFILFSLFCGNYKVVELRMERTGANSVREVRQEKLSSQRAKYEKSHDEIKHNSMQKAGRL